MRLSVIQFFTFLFSFILVKAEYCVCVCVAVLSRACVFLILSFLIVPLNANYYFRRESERREMCA